MPDNAPQQNTNNSPKEPAFKTLEELIKKTHSKSSDEIREPSNKTSEEKPHMLFERDLEQIRPILETKKPTIKQTIREKPKEKTPKARIELPE